MKAVFLLAGRGSRMAPLTDTTPKPMLRVAGKTLIDHKLEALPEHVTELVFIVGYLGHVIRDAYGSKWRGRNITYVEEPLARGTGYALFKAKDAIGTGSFIVLNGDDVYHPEDLAKVGQTNEWGIFAYEKTGGFSGGRIEHDGLGRLIDIREGTFTDPSLINIGVYYLDERIFDFEPVAIPGRNEFGLPQTIVHAVKKTGIPVRIHTAKTFIQFTTPHDIEHGQLTLQIEGLI
jgi:NDP-sugar pyrophosphorylase family protein